MYFRSVQRGIIVAHGVSLLMEYRGSRHITLEISSALMTHIYSFKI